MSGHSKWSTIKRKKGALDSKRAKIFTRILKEISISIKEGGSADPDANPRLRLAINNAKGVNMPKDNIQRAINKASDKNNSANFSETTYEGYGPSGIAIFVECTTDNINRTVANVRLILSKNGGSLGTNGSLSFLFDRKGVFTVPQNNLSEEDFTMDMIDAGAEDVQLDEGIFTIYTSFENFSVLQKKLEQLKIEYENAEIQRIPKDTVSLDLDSSKKVMKLVEALEEDDDVSAVYHNMEITEELMESL
jgi:YebC/PmpR family DNA-binding regulatory protein